VDFNLANAKNVSLLFSWFLAGPCHRVQNLFIFLNIFPLPFWCAFRIDSLLFFFVFPLKKKRKRKERQQEQQEQPVYKLLLLLYTLGRRWFSDSVFDSAFKRARAVRACGWCGFNFAWMDGASFPAAATRQML
jgi:hypothetical protein